MSLSIALCSCGPKISATKDPVLGRAVTIKNADTGRFVIQRVIANGSPENSSCNDYPNKSLDPGETYDTTFVICGAVQKIEVDTDKGTSVVDWAAQ